MDGQASDLEQNTGPVHRMLSVFSFVAARTTDDDVLRPIRPAERERHDVIDMIPARHILLTPKASVRLPFTLIRNVLGRMAPLAFSLLGGASALPCGAFLRISQPVFRSSLPQKFSVGSRPGGSPHSRLCALLSRPAPSSVIFVQSLAVQLSILARVFEILVAPLAVASLLDFAFFFGVSVSPLTSILGVRRPAHMASAPQAIPPNCSMSLREIHVNQYIMGRHER